MSNKKERKNRIEHAFLENKYGSKDYYENSSNYLEERNNLIDEVYALIDTDNKTVKEIIESFSTLKEKAKEYGVEAKNIVIIDEDISDPFSCKCSGPEMETFMYVMEDE